MMREQIIGDYRVIKQIGQGTLGSVLLAEHRFIKKQYVLKVLPQELSQEPGFIGRFEEEVAKLSLLEHPHIVKIHNVSSSEDIYFLVSDCVLDSIGETTNLAQYMSGRKEPLREDELLSVMTQIADALDYAHLKGQVVHRALKLNNILIGKGNPGIEVMISDFGLAKIVGVGKIICRAFLSVAEALEALPVEKGKEERYSPLPIDDDKFSKLGQSFLQNYAFLAPEQKHFELVGMQADTYAFGVLAYYLITGLFPEGVFDLPTRGISHYRYNWNEMIMQCLQQDPTRRPTQLKSLLNCMVNGSFVNPLQDVPGEIRPIVDDEKEKTEPLKEAIYAKVPAPKKEEIQLKPVIRRVEEKIAITSSGTEEVVSVVSVEQEDVAEPVEESVDKDVSYAEQLNAMLNRDPVVTQYQPEIVKNTKNIEPLQTEMVVILGGEFWRGSNNASRDEMPCHKVVINSFALDIHPVTNEQFVRFLEYVGGEKDNQYNDLIRFKDSRISRSAGKLSIEPGYAHHPVVGVTWYGAFAYAKWVGKRLPTEAEWEVAAQGGLEHNLYPTGNNVEKNQANFFSSDTTKVMSYNANHYGIYDMAGNVYEWCHDWYGYNYYETTQHEPHNPQGPHQGVYRVLKGGCWKSLKEDLRSAHRHRNNPGTVNSTYGFRCAADVQ